MKKALITGIAGQDGSYLAELLCKEGYAVSGVVRPDSDVRNLQSVLTQIELKKGDLLDEAFVYALVSERFDEIYNLGSISNILSSWEKPLEAMRSTAMVPLIILEAIRTTLPNTRFFQASSAEMYGDPVESPQTERTYFTPRTPYGYGKLLAHQAVEGYRAQHRMFAVSGILFNHESPRRPEYFVTRKITSTLARITKGSDEVLELGNLDSKRDWSFAGDIVRAMWLSIQYKKPDTYVFASGKSHTVREFVEAAAQALGMSLKWRGEGTEEQGIDASGRVVVKVNQQFYRPAEKNPWCGDITKIQKELGWKAQVSFEETVALMVKADLGK